MKNLFNLRTEKKMSQLNLGMKIEVDQATISGYESGRNYPSVENLLKLCDFFHVSADYLLDKTDVRLPVDELVTDRFEKSDLELLALLRGLSPDKKERAIGIVMGLLG